MSDAVLSIGANLGDRLARLQSAVDAFRAELVAVSPVYETPPWGPVEQGPFLNAVLLVRDPDADGREWLRRAHAAEDAQGRTRERRWGPRTLDVDVVDVAGETSETPELTLPHPRAADRAFVLVPWLALDPAARLGGRAVAALVAGLPDEDVAGVRPADDLVLR